jgi:WD40 repeat protein
VLRGHEEAVQSASWSTDGRRIVTAGSDGTIRVLPLGGGRPIVLYGHQGAVRSAQLNRRGDRIVSAGVDGTVRVWSAEGEALLVVYRHSAPATAAWSPDGRRIVSAGGGVVRVSACDVCGSFHAVLDAARERSDQELSPVERSRFLDEDG